MTETLASALAEFQRRLPRIEKTGRATVPTKAGGSYSYTYAGLPDVAAKVLPLLGEVGLSFLARPTLVDGRLVLAYSLLHASGQREDGLYPLPANGTPQEIGSAITYGRRYSLCAVTGIAPDDDDDGAAATAAVRRQAEYTVTKPASPTTTELVDRLTQAGITGQELGVAYISETLDREVRDDLRDLAPDDIRKVLARLDEEAQLGLDDQEATS